MYTWSKYLCSLLGPTTCTFFTVSILLVNWFWREVPCIPNFPRYHINVLISLFLSYLLYLFQSPFHWCVGQDGKGEFLLVHSTSLSRTRYMYRPWSWFFRNWDFLLTESRIDGLGSFSSWFWKVLIWQKNNKKKKIDWTIAIWRNGVTSILTLLLAETLTCLVDLSLVCQSC